MSSRLFKVGLNKFLMKALSLLLCVVMQIPMISYLTSLSSINANAAADYVPISAGKKLIECFPDKDFAKYVYNLILSKHYWDTYGNDYVLRPDDIAKIKNATSIDISERKTISNLTGIKNFSNLKSLICCDNTDLSFIDVSGCTKLVQLNCTRSKIKELNISDCYNLTELNASECSELNGLDLSTCSNLKKLDVSSCSKIIELNISNCSNLTELNASRCSNLNGLNLSTCSSLEKLDVSRCFKIIELNVSECSNLKNLRCKGTKITKLDVSKCKKLENINCGYTKITNLDVSNMKNLEKLVCRHNQSLTSINVKGCSNLKYLLISDTSISSIDVSGIEFHKINLSRNPKLSTINIDGNKENMNPPEGKFLIRCGQASTNASKESSAVENDDSAKGSQKSNAIASGNKNQDYPRFNLSQKSNERKKFNADWQIGSISIL